MTPLQIVGIVALCVIVAIEIATFILEVLDRRRERREREQFHRDYDTFIRSDKVSPRS